MKESRSVLKMRVLQYFIMGDEKKRNVTGIAKTLGEEKYTISRIIAELADIGFIDRTDSRNPVLTAEGRRMAEHYAEKINDAVEVLTDAGIDASSARRDGFLWGCYNSSQTADFIGSLNRNKKIRNRCSERKSFNGEYFESLIDDGIYEYVFALYRKNDIYGNGLSQLSEDFENPCSIHVADGKGLIQLKNLPVITGGTGNVYSGGRKRTTETVKYFCDGVWEDSERSGNIFTFPLSALSFSAFGKGVGRIIQGQVQLKIVTSTGGVSGISETLFSIFI